VTAFTAHPTISPNNASAAVDCTSMMYFALVGERHHVGG
jgi:hypothetical protein